MYLTILSPDSVRRVTPPRTTAPNAIPAMPPIHQPTILGVVTGLGISVTTVVVHRVAPFRKICESFF
jgi:hypothetical protein